MSPYRHTFPNGLRLVVYPMAETRSVALGLFVRGGALYDPPGQPGLSHALEHMVCEGTATLTRDAILATFEADGGSFNAVTTPDYVGLLGETLDEHWIDALRTLLAIARAPRLDPAVWALEQGAIQSEIADDRESPRSRCAIAARVVALGEAHPGTLPVGGTPETVAAITVEDLARHHARMFLPGNVVISIAGNVDVVAASLLVEELTHAWRGEATSLVVPPHIYAGGVAYQACPELQGVFAQVVFPAPQVEFRKALHVGVLDDLLVGHGAAALLTELRYNQGLVYDVAGGYSQSRVGLYTLQFATAAKDYDRALDALLRVVYDGQSWITEPAVQASIRRINGALLMVETLPTPRMVRHGLSWLLTGTVRTPEAVVAELRRLTVPALQEVAQHYFKPAWAAIAAVGPAMPA